MATTVKQKINTTSKKIYIYEIDCIKNINGIDEVQEFKFTEKLFLEIDKIKSSLSYDNKNNNQWYSIESISIKDNFIDCILVCCKYNYRPNLIDVETRKERQSPKTNSEGDKEKTHITIRDNIIAYEQKRNGTSAAILTKFLNSVWQNIKETVDDSIHSIILKQVLDNNFLETIKKAKDIKNAKFIVESKLLGSDFFNFGNDSGVEDLYTLEIKAKKRQSINKNKFIEKIERILVEKVTISKVTVKINDEDNNPRIINTDFFAKQFNITVEKNKNGEVIDDDIFFKLKNLL